MHREKQSGPASLSSLIETMSMRYSDGYSKIDKKLLFIVSLSWEGMEYVEPNAKFATSYFIFIEMLSSLTHRNRVGERLRSASTPAPPRFLRS